MSFLKVMIPAESLDSLLDDIRKQLAVGRFTVGSPGYGNHIATPTKELKRLMEILQRELQVRRQYVYTLVHNQGEWAN